MNYFACTTESDMVFFWFPESSGEPHLGIVGHVLFCEQQHGVFVDRGVQRFDQVWDALLALAQDARPQGPTPE